MKKPYATEQLAVSAMDYYNSKAHITGWNTVKGVYFCPNHQAWHLTTMKQSDARNTAKWAAGLTKSGTKLLQRRQKHFDHYLKLCQQNLLHSDDIYKKPTRENHEAFMISLVGQKRWPVKFKHVDMWWRKLPAHQKHTDEEQTTTPDP